MKERGLIKFVFFAIALFFAASNLTAQECYRENVKNGKEQLELEKYADAKTYFEAALKCEEKINEGKEAEKLLERANNLLIDLEEYNFTEDIEGVSFKMIYVIGGKFSMGSENYSSESPTHNVTLDNYYIGEVEVTFALYDTYCRAVDVERPLDNGSGRGEHSVVSVSWEDAVGFCEWLEIQTGRKYRLPTEAEWEYAARGGIRSKGTLYSGNNSLQNVGWYKGNSEGKVHVGKGKWPNELGIYDMSGNVWEWCSDWSGPYKGTSQTNPTGAASGSKRVYRGGCFYYPASQCRVSNRSSAVSDGRHANIGFRLVVSSK